MTCSLLPPSNTLISCSAVSSSPLRSRSAMVMRPLMRALPYQQLSGSGAGDASHSVMKRWNRWRRETVPARVVATVETGSKMVSRALPETVSCASRSSLPTMAARNSGAVRTPAVGEVPMSSVQMSARRCDAEHLITPRDVPSASVPRRSMRTSPEPGSGSANRHCTCPSACAGAWQPAVPIPQPQGKYREFAQASHGQ
jgi:hypothetical protein